jgi:hypothetical protein
MRILFAISLGDPPRFSATRLTARRSRRFSVNVRTYFVCKVKFRQRVRSFHWISLWITFSPFNWIEKPCTEFSGKLSGCFNCTSFYRLEFAGCRSDAIALAFTDRRRTTKFLTNDRSLARCRSTTRICDAWDGEPKVHNGACCSLDFQTSYTSRIIEWASYKRYVHAGIALVLSLQRNRVDDADASYIYWYYSRTFFTR